LLGTVRWRIGDHRGAAEAFERSLEIYRENGFERDPDVAQALYGKAVLLMDLADYESARPLLERALALRESELGPDHTEIGWISVILGRSYLETGRLEDARPFFERALDIQKRSVGPNHPSMALPLTKLAIIDRRQGEADLARHRFETAINIVERVQGQDHPDLVWMLVPYSRCLRLAGEIEDARAAIERAVAIAEGSYGAIHVETARAVEGLAYHYYGLRDYGEALRHFDHAYEIRARVFGAGHRALGWNCYDRACVLALKGDRHAAVEALREAVAVGWASDLLFSDDDLDSLRGDLEFQAVADRVRRKQTPGSTPG
jgi:tetratricopeptide (TPR) repeat protein